MKVRQFIQPANAGETGEIPRALRDWSANVVAAFDRLDRQFPGYSPYGLGAATGGGGLLSVVNASGADLLIIDFFLEIRTVAAGVFGDFGTTAVSSTTASNNIFNAQALGTAGIFRSQLMVNGAAYALNWAKDTWITGSVNGAGDPAGLVGECYVVCLVRQPQS